MHGTALKDYLRRNGITQEKAAEQLNISRQTLTVWLRTGQFDAEQQRRIMAAFNLPASFFALSDSRVNEDAVGYSATAALAECVKERAVLEERVSQLELRLQEKDATIKLLTKHLKA